MLTEEQEDILSEAIQPLFQYLEKEVIVDIARRIAKTLTYTRTAELQAVELQRLGFSPARIRKEAMKLLRADAAFRKEVAKHTLEYKHRIRKRINETIREAQRAGNRIITDAGDMAWVDDLRVWKQGNIELNDNSFLHQLTDAFSAQTAGRLENLTRSSGFRAVSGFESIENAYRRELDRAVMKICTGTFSQEKVLRDTIHGLAQSGLRSVDYASGHSMQLDAATRLALRTGCHQISGKVTDQNLERTGVNLVYVSQHQGARNKGEGVENHEQWQGKVYYIRPGTDYTREARRIGQERIMDLWYATGYSVDGAHPNDPRGLDGYNCRHRRNPWFEGASSLPKVQPQPAPVTVNGKTYDYYAMTQRLRYMERTIRGLKREKEAMEALQLDTKELQTKIRAKIREYKEFCAAYGLPSSSTKLRYECGTSDLKKTQAWKRYVGMTGRMERDLNLGKVRGIRLRSSAERGAISEEDMEEIRETIKELGEEYEIKLDELELKDYTEDRYRYVPAFYTETVDRFGRYGGKLVINSACHFWTDERERKIMLGMGYFAGSSVKDFIIHEIAHVMTFQGCTTLKEAVLLGEELRSMYVKGLSQYNSICKEGSETIAEAFVLARKGERLPVKARKLLERYIEVWRR